jgi:4-deoxy-L-threo-5-hexosulose-uronate ketol-isomerase
MRVYTTPSDREAANLSTAALRSQFLVEGLFQSGRLELANTGLDRMVIGGAVPVGEPLALPPMAEFGTGSFAERREVGILNIGQAGEVSVDGTVFRLENLDGLYVGAGHREIVFLNGGSPAVFYLASCPAHCPYPTRLIRHEDVAAEALGFARSASRRWLRKYIHPGGVSSAQLVMGYTEVPEGSVWNTMPPHTHACRTEVYLYFDLGEGVVVHLMGRPEETRHLVVRDREAVLSPSWSLHAGAGTGPYRFVWAMAGENQSFHNVDPVDLAGLR